MAYVSLLTLTQTLEQILNPDQRLILLDEQQIRCLHEKVSFLLSFLEDPSQEGSETITCMEGRIRDAACEAEDIIESHRSNQILLESASPGVISCFCELIAALSNVMPFNQHESSVQFRHHNFEEKYEELQKVINELDSIKEEVVMMKDSNERDDLQPSNSLPSGSSKPVLSNKGSMVGFDHHLMQIKDQLTGPPSNLEIISIVGMGGIGKTTLARNVYDDSLIVYHFDTRAWITISQEYSVQELLMGLVDSTRRLSRESHVESTEKLREQLYQSLKGRRYLIAMDDVWDTNAWEEVKRLFPDDKNGSRIILTSRLSDVAIYASSTGPIHRLSFLSLEESWNLLRQNVFGEEDCPPDFEEIGKEIAEKCKGHPLTLVVLGGLLNKATRARDWEDSVETLNSEVTEIGDKVLEMLSLSYSHLPYHLRACFLYFGRFPEDYEIRTSKLIKLWVAEGFVKPVTTKSLEEVAEEYLEDLIARNMILVHERSYIGEVKTCSIHDLMRELCVRKAQEEKFLYKYGSLVRSLLFFSRNTDIRLFSDTKYYRLLRVLDALTLRFDDFPIEMVELVNLRFIALTYMGNCKLPASIAKLRNLQTLLFYQGKFKVNINTLYLPAEIWKMPQLRHILFEKCFLPYPSGARNWKKFVGWENLTTLCKVTNFRCTREVLQMMPNLKKLGVSYYHGSWTNWSSYGFDNFIHLHQLENLKCVFIAKSFLAYRDPPPLNFAFPPKLKKLTLSGCRISWKNMTMVGSLPNLEVLKLKDHALQGTVWEPNEGEFCRLKLLVIHMSFLEHWKANETHFPSLQCLRLFYCINLVEIPSEIGDIPTLQAIHLYECSPSAETSARLIQEEQEGLGNDDFQLLVRTLFDEKEMRYPPAGEDAMRVSCLHRFGWRGLQDEENNDSS